MKNLKVRFTSFVTAIMMAMGPAGIEFVRNATALGAVELINALNNQTTVTDTVKTR